MLGAPTFDPARNRAWRFHGTNTGAMMPPRKRTGEHARERGGDGVTETRLRKQESSWVRLPASRGRDTKGFVISGG